jgi:molybdate transport system ATP-binding protein
MKLELAGLRRPLADFELAVDAALERPATVLFGPSGAGKTALLELIAGLERPSAGRIVLDGRALFDAGRGIDLPARARGVGYVPQDGALFPHLSVAANLEYALAARRLTDRATLERAIAALELASLLERSPRTLSGGERRRVALGRALVAAPALLLLDEPLAGLDRRRAERALADIRRVHAELGVPLLYVTHQRAEALAIGDEALVLDQGRIVARGAPAAVLD